MDLTRSALDMLEQEKTQTVEVSTSLEARASSRESEVFKMKKEERKLRLQVSKLEADREKANKVCLEFEDAFKTMEEERLALKMELADKKASLETLKEELVKAEDKLSHEKALANRLQSQLDEDAEEKEKVGMDVL